MQEGDLLERVGPVRDHNAAAAVGLGDRRARDIERLGRAELDARAGVDRARAQAGHLSQGWNRLHERVRVEVRNRPAAVPLRHRDRPAGGEHGDLSDGRVEHRASLREIVHKTIFPW